MIFDNPILFFLCSIGVFNGVLASIYFLFFSKEKRVQNSLFGLLLFLLSVRIGKSVYVLSAPRGERDLLFVQIGLSACFLIGVALFYYLKASVKNIKVIPVSWKIHFLVLFAFITIMGVLKPYATYTVFWNTNFAYFIYWVWGIYLVVSGIILKDILKKIVEKNKKCTISEKWLLAVFLANLIIFLAYLIGMFYLYLIGTITFSIVFYALLVFILFKNNRANIFKDIPTKYASKKINEAAAIILQESLDIAMEQKEFYKDTNVKLNNIAKELGVSSHQLSQFLNDNLGKSFALFINEYRIEEAKKLLKEKSQFTLEAIGFEAGFSSKSSFYATFKKMVGVTPSVFRDN